VQADEQWYLKKSLCVHCFIASAYQALRSAAFHGSASRRTLSRRQEQQAKKPGDVAAFHDGGI
jgi:hypothetical protein